VRRKRSRSTAPSTARPVRVGGQAGQRRHPLPQLQRQRSGDAQPAEPLRGASPLLPPAGSARGRTHRQGALPPLPRPRRGEAEAHSQGQHSAGIDSGTQIRISREGEAGARGGSPGDLFVTVTVREHELFTRSNDDLIYELPVNFVQAALGAEVEVPTLTSQARLKIPPGSQTGQVFKLKARGSPPAPRRLRRLAGKPFRGHARLIERQAAPVAQGTGNSLGEGNMPGLKKLRDHREGR